MQLHRVLGLGEQRAFLREWRRRWAHHSVVLEPRAPSSVLYYTTNLDEAMAVLVKMITQKLVVCRHIKIDFPHGSMIFSL